MSYIGQREDEWEAEQVKLKRKQIRKLFLIGWTTIKEIMKAIRTGAERP